MSDTPRTDSAIRNSGGQWSYVLRDTCEQLERELAEAQKENVKLNAVADEHITRYHETCLKLETALFGTEGDSFAQVAKQRDELAEALKSLCRAIISDEPQDITDLLKQSGAAIAAVEGGQP